MWSSQLNEQPKSGKILSVEFSTTNNRERQPTGARWRHNQILSYQKVSSFYNNITVCAPLVRPAPGPAGFTLWCNFREEHKVTEQTKLSSVYWFVYLLKLDSRFSRSSEGWY